VRALAFLLPLIAGFFAGAFVANRLRQPETVSGIVVWWMMVIGMASVAAHIVDRYSRRLIPLSGLLRMTMAFPDKAPSRFRVAQRASNFTELQRRIEQAGTGGDPDLAAASEMILSLATALSHHDRKTRGHSERTRAYADLLGEELRLSEDDRDRLRWAALLHDVGKLAVPAEILNKDGPLDEAEWEVIKTHPVEGMRLIAPIVEWMGPWAKTVEHHHERWDGTGYPFGLRGEEIALGARIVAVADAYDVITSGRTYQETRTHAEARKEVARHSGTQFDPRVVRALMNVALGKLRWSTGPLAALADFPFLRPLEALGRDVVTLATAGALTASAAVAGVLPVPDVSRVDPNRAAAVIAESFGLEPITTPPPIVPATTEPPTTTTEEESTTTTEEPTTTAAPTTTHRPTTTTQRPTTTAPPTTTTAPPTTTTAPPTTTTAPTTTAPTTTAPTTTSPPTTVSGVVARDDSASTGGGPDPYGVRVNVLANDTYGSGPVVTITQPPATGTAWVTGNNRIRYQAPNGFTGTVTLTYQLCDSSGGCSSAVVTITVP
jgi:response regulator RpfG family c-di-GMP phosphodiesterase